MQEVSKPPLVPCRIASLRPQVSRLRHSSPRGPAPESPVFVTDTPLSWLRSYLESRTQFVKLCQHQSPAVGLDVGVPQGFVLGPLRFAVYCSPAADVIVSHDVQFHQYAETAAAQPGQVGGTEHWHC